MKRNQTKYFVVYKGVGLIYGNLVFLNHVIKLKKMKVCDDFMSICFQLKLFLLSLPTIKTITN
jgi:hypothetical protein